MIVCQVAENFNPPKVGIEEPLSPLSFRGGLLGNSNPPRVVNRKPSYNIKPPTVHGQHIQLIGAGSV